MLFWWGCQRQARTVLLRSIGAGQLHERQVRAFLPLQGGGQEGDGVEKHDYWSTFSADVSHPHPNPSNRKRRWRELPLREAHPKG